jgi:hypothetical protein
MRHVFVFVGLLFLLQQMQGTIPLVSVCSCLFVVVAAIAFNLAGGFTRPSGTYVFFYAVLGVIVGLCWKVVLWEPADKNLLQPVLTMEVFLGGITSMLAAVWIAKQFRRKTAFLQNIVSESNMRNATLGCLLTGTALTGAGALIPHVPGSALSALEQINRFLPMAVILGVTHSIRASGGTKSVSFPVWVGGGLIFFMGGILGFSKEGMLTPFLCWALAAGALRFRVSLGQVAGLIGAIVFIFYFLVPYSQFGRTQVPDGASLGDKIQISANLLSSPIKLRRSVQAGAREMYDELRTGYFDSPQGFFDRLQMISVDDGLIDATERLGPFGLLPMYVAVENIVPHFLWPNKPQVAFGNVFAHDIGGLPEDDTTTGISFTPSGEAFRLERWAGIFILAPIMWTTLFIVWDSICGEVHKSPWGLLAAAMFAHAAPEGMLDGIVYMIGYGAFAVVFAAWAAAYVMPLIGTLMAGPEARARGRKAAAVQSLPRRVSTVTESGVR